jgi:NADH-quinone oxidoreductase subunit M
MNNSLISLMLLLPFTGAVLQAASTLPRRPGPDGEVVKSDADRDIFRWIAFASSLASAICGLILLFQMKSGVAAPQHAETFSWVGAYSITYALAVDGMSAPVLLLISIVFPILIAAEWMRARGRQGIHGLLLLVQSALIGAVCAQDLFLLFFFWSLSAFPIYFLIGIWGGEEREVAAFRTFVSSVIGNTLFFGAMLLVYYSFEPRSFLIGELAGRPQPDWGFELLGVRIAVADLAFLLMAMGLVFRAPIWPFHGWFIKSAHQAPASVLVAIIIMGIPVSSLIFLRLSLTLFPQVFAGAATSVVAVGVVNIVVGGLCALAQRQLRPLLGYLGLGQLGLLLLGVASLDPAGLVGVVYQQLVSGLALAGLGLLIGIVVERASLDFFGENRGEDSASRLGGLAQQAPAAALVAAVACASLLGVPGLGGFISQSLLMIGGYAVTPWAVFAAVVAMIFSAITLLGMYRHAFLGELTPATTSFSDLLSRERLFLFPLIFGLVFFGVYPKPMVDLIRPTVAQLMKGGVK